MKSKSAATPAHIGWRLALANAGLPVVALLLILIAGAVWAAWRLLDPTPEKRMVIATGPEEGAYEVFASRYLPLLQAQGVAVTLRRTQGSGENLALLRDPASGVQVAFVQGGLDSDGGGDTAVTTAGNAGGNAAGNAGGGHARLVSLGSVAIEPLWLFYREAAPSGRSSTLATQPDKLAQLAGWRIDTGPAGGGSDGLFRQLAAASGLAEDGFQSGDPMSVKRVLSLVQGQVEALALVSAPEAPLLQYLLQTPGIRLFDFGQAEAYARRFSYLRPLSLPRGVVDLAGDRPPQDVRLVAATSSLVARSDLHPALMQLLLQTAHRVHAEPGWFNRRSEFPNANVDTVPLAAEAARYYRDGPPWLQRHLPFWLANFVDRMWIVLLPLLAVLLPLSRVLPPLVTLRLRSRIYRWYANLRALEAAIEQPDAELQALQDELEHLDAQTERIGVPLSFTNELYELRSHIHLVRRRLQARRSGEGTPRGA